jgi:predicted transcriptional regulator
MRMARVNITVPDEIVARARTAGLNVSRVATAALREELDRRDKIAALDAYLAALEAELGQVPPDEEAAARAWVDGVLGPAAPSTRRRSA